MIYVMRSAAFKPGGSYETIIKIGYTGENSKKTRFDLYLTENPTIKVLYLIPHGTTRDEKNLHRHFNQYLLYGNEWFKDVPEIIEFFENHKTKESLKELEKWKLNKSQKRKSSENRKHNKNKIYLINISIKSILKENLDDDQQIKELENYLWYRLDDFWDVIRDEFGEYEEEIKKEIRKLVVISEELNDLRDVYNSFIDEFEKDNNFERRMRLIYDINVEYPQLFVQYSRLLSVKLPMNIQNYINLLGFEKIKSLEYREKNIVDYINSQNNLQSNPIISLFTIGSKYSKAQIKEMLRKFYDENNITKTPKATDLLDYFDLKPCQFIDKSLGKRVDGFLIMNKKED